MMRSEVLIVGAGPTGLVLALWLTKLGVRVRIIDKTAEPGATSRALAVQARTLELYRQLDLADAVIEKGHKVPAVNLWAAGERKARLDFTHIGAALTPYSFMEIFPQDEHEQLLVERLDAMGVSVERRTELLSFREEGDHIVARIRGADELEERCEANFIAGADGARSLVRRTLGVGFPGGTYQKVFYVADVEASGPAIHGELHVDLDVADFVAVFPRAQEGRARLVGTIREDRAAPADTLKFEDVSSRAINNLKIQIEKVNWFSTYHVHHRVADHFRKGRAFLLGDAAHVHSPVGGQGMNTGIGDAINLAWKLASVLQGHGPDALLDSYDPERIEFARKLVATTDRAFTLVTAEGRLADVVRTRIAPAVLSKLVRFEFARNLLFRTASQTTLNYRTSPLSEGKAGDVHGGDRLPWARAAGADNFDSLSETGWQVHVYGSATQKLSAWCRGHDVPLRIFGWSKETEATGLARDALYLLRPDTYVALADPSGDPDAIDRYFTQRGILVGAGDGNRTRV
jgi:2-polyprenyl-6-methoxyphenol hydroxylase-like FAD-dependent oxidoreductase